MPAQLKARLKGIVASAARGLVSLRILPRRVIINVDGGICSQMHFCLVGRVLAARGAEVRFDTNWFRKSGMDNDGRFCRNFDLLKAFPRLDFPVENTGLLRRLYISAFYRHNDYYDTTRAHEWMNVVAPVYFDGYFRDTDGMFGAFFSDLFRVDTSVLPADNLPVLAEIEEAGRGGGSCAVHIRRGDLARYEKAYGDPATVGYFREAVAKVRAESPGTRFFVFSDEPDWCRCHVLPAIGESGVSVVDVNGSDRGWCDLILMSRCNHHVTSQGSMGKYAALLREPAQRAGLVTLPPNATSTEWLCRFPHATAISG